MTEPTLVVIAKQPVAGRVKTRLVPPCSPAEAAALAEASLADTLAAVVGAVASRRVLVLDGAPDWWLPEGFEVIPQAGGGLDARLAAAFDAVGGPTLLVGMDTPQVTSRLLDDAAQRLGRDGVGAVLGESEDGGYWAVGLSKPYRRVFEGVPMSCPWTARAQRGRLDSLGIRCTALPVLRDVDTIADARAVAAAHPTLRFASVFASLPARESEWAVGTG